MPHGAYFGIAALMVASLVAPEQERSGGSARLMLGLTIATVVGGAFRECSGPDRRLGVGPLRWSVRWPC